MQTVAALLLVTALYPLARAWQATRGTTLGYALAWGSAAWACWHFHVTAKDVLKLLVG